MKPTKRIIELAKRLNELGYRQEVREDMWFISQGVFYSVSTIHYDVADKPVKVGVWDGDHKMLWFGVNGIIPIPSLSDGLEWLRKTLGRSDIIAVIGGIKTWSCAYGNLDDQFVEADTPHEAVLLAMVKVMEDRRPK